MQRARGFGTTYGAATTDRIASPASFTTPSKLTIMCWVMRNADGTLSFGRICAKDGSTAGDFSVNRQDSSTMQFQRKFSTTNGTWTLNNSALNQQRQWNHLAITYDDSATTNVPVAYVNGRSFAFTTSVTPVGTATSGSGILNIGNASSGVREWDGGLGDLGLYSDMLTIGEIMGNFQGRDMRLIRPEDVVELCIVSGSRPFSWKFKRPMTLVGTRQTRSPAILRAKPVQFASPASSYSLACAAGAFTLSGVAAGLAAQRRLAGAAGSFALAGQAAGLAAQRRLAAEAASYALTGQPAGLLAAYRLTAAAGAFTLTGIAARLAALRNLPAGAGAFVLSGIDAGLRSARMLQASTGAFVLAGQDAALIYTTGGLALAAGTGAFSLTGVAANLRASRVLPAGAGTFSLAGVAAGLAAQRRIPAGAGSFALTGISAGLTAQRRLNASSGAFVLVGVAAGLRRAAQLSAGIGQFILTGQEVLLSGSGSLVGGGSPARTFSATIRQATFKGAPRDNTFRRAG